MHFIGHCLSCVPSLVCLDAWKSASDRDDSQSLTRPPPDTLSPVYPDRPIRPLPKNRLKSRLSPEQSATLIYPPDPPISSISFNFPFGQTERDKAEDARLANGHGPNDGAVVTHCTCGAEHGDESDSEEIVYDHPNFRVQSPTEGLQQRRATASHALSSGPGPGQAAAGLGMRAVGKTPAAPASIASSADGYESFENTSNKKKRKIPLSASSAVHQSAMTAAHQSTLTSELANMGIASQQDGTQDHVPLSSSSSYAASTTGMGPAGAGRGRGSKSSPMRRRERVSMSHLTNANGHSYAAEQSVERGGAYKGDGTRISET